MPYISVATHLRVGDTLRSPVLIPFDALARSQLNPDDPLSRRLSSFLLPQSKRDLQKFQCRLITHSPPCVNLKPSLKCSRGRRGISGQTTPRTHSPSPARRSPPPASKCVRFKDKDGELESVCLFRATGRPSSISHPRSHSDTETETDTDSALVAQRIGSTNFTLADISPIPSPHTPPASNVHLESLALLPARPPLLRGTVRVRNLSFEKCVAARFTTDGWTTVSEAHARYVGPARGADDDDDAADAWDLFAFTIPLLSAAAATAPRTLLLAVRYTVPGSTDEWWDNNGGADFRAVLAPVTVSGGVKAAALRPRRALVGACRASVAAANACAHPTLAQRSSATSP